MDIDGFERLIGVSSARLMSTILLFLQERLPVLIVKRSSMLAGGIVDQGSEAKKSLGTAEWKRRGRDGPLTSVIIGPWAI